MRYMQIAVSGLAAYDLNNGRTDISAQVDGVFIEHKAPRCDIVGLDSSFNPGSDSLSITPVEDVLEIRIPVSIPGKSDIDYSAISGSSKETVISELVNVAFE